MQRKENTGGSGSGAEQKEPELESKLNRFEQAYNSYADAMRGAGESANQAFRTAYDKLAQDLCSAQQAEHVQKLYTGYLQTVQDTALPPADALKSAWAKFMAASQGAFAQLDASTTAAELAAVAQVLGAAASLAARNEGPWKVAGLYNNNPASIVVTR